MGRIVSYNYTINNIDSNIYGTGQLEGVLIELHDNSLNRIDQFVKQIILEKTKEPHHKKDGNHEFKRFSTGTKGERALEILLDRTFIDWTTGNSNVYNRSDLRSLGLNVGVKSVELGKAPLIFKRSYSPEIMTIVINNRYILICGFASRAVLNNPDNQSMDAVLSPDLRKRGTKTAFVAFDKLHKFYSYRDLECLVRNNV